MAQQGGLEVRLRSARLKAGLSQGELAGRAGITRQAISAIEGGKAVPTTAVALRLARALGVRIEELFRLVDELPRVEAELLPPRQPLPGGPLRVQIATVGARTLARPLAGASGVALGLTRANGLIRAPSVDALAQVELFGDPDRLGSTVVAVGCDPAAALLADHLRERYPSFDLAWQGGGSTAALEAVARGEAHLAGCHLLDPASGQYNLPYVRALFGDRADVVTFAVWEQGLMVAAGNPHGIGGVGDLVRPDIRFVNREAGTGARALLDSRLAALGLGPADLPGYGRIVSSHLAVAEAIAAGLADVGIGVRAAAQALGLGFLPLAEERYDLVIPHAYFELPPVQALLETLSSPLFRLEVEALGGYDVRPMGTLVLAA
jgi:molybdopterin molybdotransferase/putative molybdopterin biosynthesis protein